MNLIPEPQMYKTLDEKDFLIKNSTKIVIASNCNFADLESAQLLQQEIKDSLGLKIAITKINEAKNASFLADGSHILFKKISKEGDKLEEYKLSINNDKIEIQAYDDAGLFYGVQTLRQIIRLKGSKLPALLIEDSPHFSNRGFYHDVTRGKVPKLDTLKELANRLSFYKINQLQLYVEHTFAFEGMSEIWMDKDPLSAEEILILDEYCRRRQIELLPSLSTFGHLYEALRTTSYKHLSELEIDLTRPYSWINRQRHHTLNVSNPDSFEFVKEMLDQYIPLFSSKKFNICCDETFDLGKGRNKELASKVGKGRLYIDFLNKIIRYVQGYNKEVMFWGDIILEHPELLGEIPEGVTCLNWEYSALPDENKVKTVADSGIKQYLCPGVAGWNNLMNDMDTASLNISRMINYGKNYGAIGVLNTDWGDYGHINLLGNSIPGMALGAALSWNPEMIDSSFMDDDNKILNKMREIDEEISKIEYRDSEGKIVYLLRGLSRQHIIDWGMIIRWKEEKFKQTENAFYDREKFLSLSQEEIIEGYNKTLKILDSIIEINVGQGNEDSLDYQEFIISARGVALLNVLGLIIKKYDYRQDITETVFSSDKLAEELEYWLFDYKEVWRKRNKESELYKIVEAVQSISSYLRSLLFKEK
ncbi:glycoside hydrolase family 20 zincin-like fold domain-containing protein [Natronospora cellulosivora (SeqCode)]